MRLYEFEDDYSWVESAAENITRDCQPFLRRLGGEKLTLYRGMNYSWAHNAGNFVKLPCPVNRQPTGTPLNIHQLCDDWFLKNFNIRYRSNAVFATSEMDRAWIYGPIFAVFPIGQFSFCYSPKIVDLLEAWDQPQEVMQRMSDDDARSLVNRTLTFGHYSNTNLPAAINSSCEVMIHCNEYYLVNVSKSTKYVLNLLNHYL